MWQKYTLYFFFLVYNKEQKKKKVLPPLSPDKQYLSLIGHPAHWSVSNSVKPLSVFSKPWVSTQKVYCRLILSHQTLGITSYLTLLTEAASCSSGMRSSPAGCWVVLWSKKQLDLLYWLGRQIVPHRHLNVASKAWQAPQAVKPKIEL